MVKGRVDEAVPKGAKVLAGGEAVGPCYQATVLTDVPADSDFAQLETFGPVVSIETVDYAQDAVARANATSYGLCVGHLHAATPTAGSRWRSRSMSGIAHVNDQSVGDEPQMPFGGVKDTGFGRFGGSAVIDEFTELRWITVQEQRASVPLLSPRWQRSSPSPTRFASSSPTSDVVALEGFTHLIPHAAGARADPAGAA